MQILPRTRRWALALLLVLSLVLCGQAIEASRDVKGDPITFQADVTKMLDILVNSLYTKREIFLRELISNGSDALNKIRLLHLKSPETPSNASAEEPTMDIRISFDKEHQQLIVRDGGVGMTKEDLERNLGSLGVSGTRGFLERFQNSTAEDSNNLIGQFGVGFYSVFLVGDQVRVASKHDSSALQYVWESNGDGNFFLYEDPRGNTLGRGTEITIQLKPDTMDFLKPDLIESVIQTYSEFIDYPIYVQKEVEVTKTVPVGKNETELATNTTEEQETETETETEAELHTNETATKEVKVRELQWVLANAIKPIWMRPRAEVQEQEYNEFYQGTFKDFKNPFYYTHFKAEGDVEFDAILYIPRESDPAAMMEHVALNNIKLYIRRVMVAEEFAELMPRYLSFVRGVVDSNDLPINVAREALQENRILSVIRKKLVRKALAMLTELATHEESYHDLVQRNGSAAELEALLPARPGVKHLEGPIYEKIWEQFGIHLRLGIIQDPANRGRLSKLLRFKTSTSPTTPISLQRYVDRMPEGQKFIFYLSGDSVEHVRQSPMLQDALDRGYEVLFFTDAIDEYFIKNLPDFGGHKLVNLAHHQVRAGELTQRQRAIERKREGVYADFLEHLHKLLGKSEIQRVALTHRQTTEPFLISSNQYQMTPRLAKIVRSQAEGLEYKPIKVLRVLEVNHRHPLVDELYRRFTVDKDDAVAQDIAWVLYDTASVRADFDIQDFSSYTRRIDRLLRGSVNLSANQGLLPEDDAKYEEMIEQEEAEKLKAKAPPAAVEEEAEKTAKEMGERAGVEKEAAYEAETDL